MSTVGEDKVVGQGVDRHGDPYVVIEPATCSRCGRFHFGIGLNLCYGYFDGRPGTIINADTGEVVDTYEETDESEA